MFTLTVGIASTQMNFAQTEGLGNVTFEHANAQVHRFPPERFDLAWVEEPTNPDDVLARHDDLITLRCSHHTSTTAVSDGTYPGP